MNVEKVVKEEMNPLQKNSCSIGSNGRTDPLNPNNREPIILIKNVARELGCFKLFFTKLVIAKRLIAPNAPPIPIEINSNIFTIDNPVQDSVNGFLCLIGF